jgi:hypothetical protein
VLGHHRRLADVQALQERPVRLLEAEDDRIRVGCVDAVLHCLET